MTPDPICSARSARIRHVQQDMAGSSPGWFEAVLIVAFGGPQGQADIRPFLERVLRGRRVTPQRIEEVAHHYEIFDGVSPITRLTRLQAQGLEQRLSAAGYQLPVYVGMRNWHPLLVDTLREMHAAGIGRAVGFIAAAHHSYSSCQQYRENVAQARQELRAEVGADVDITYVGSWFDHPLFIDVNARHVRAAADRLPAEHRDKARLIFTAHSIPRSMADASRYRGGAARNIAARCRGSRYHRLGARVSKPQRTSGGSVARTGRVRLPSH